jgi:galactan endo-1,6-beta-galactosidase
MVTRRTVLGATGAAAGGAAVAGGAGGALVDGTARADARFTTRSVSCNGATLPGLGLNIARYNLGASSWNSVAGEAMVSSPNIPRFKQIEGFRVVR